MRPQSTKVLSCVRRERAEAGEFLPSDKITKAKLGIAVKRERPRQLHQAQIFLCKTCFAAQQVELLFLSILFIFLGLKYT